MLNEKHLLILHKGAGRLECPALFCFCMPCTALCRSIAAACPVSPRAKSFKFLTLPRKTLSQRLCSLDSPLLRMTFFLTQSCSFTECCPNESGSQCLLRPWAIPWAIPWANPWVRSWEKSWATTNYKALLLLFHLLSILFFPLFLYGGPRLAKGPVFSASVTL